jgi:hypothetical protein
MCVIGEPSTWRSWLRTTELAGRVGDKKDGQVIPAEFTRLVPEDNRATMQSGSLFSKEDRIQSCADILRSGEWEGLQFTVEGLEPHLQLLRSKQAETPPLASPPPALGLFRVCGAKGSLCAQL